MAKRYKKALVKSEKECKRLRAEKRQLKRELFMEMESTKHDLRLMRDQTNRISTLIMERNGKQSLLMCSSDALKDCQREVVNWKGTATLTLVAFIGILTAYIIELNGLG